MLPSESPSLSVLIVISDPDRCLQWSALFNSHGYRVTSSIDGVDALAKIQESKFDVVIASVLMDGLDGLELLRLLPDAAPDLPVIVIGSPESRFNDTYLRCATLLGAVQTFSHPPNPKAILDGVQKVVRDKKAGRKAPPQPCEYQS
jgi:CheY-like chemotaxis protein